MLTLYFTSGASSMATHIALHEVAAPFESHHISLAKNEHRTPAYLAHIRRPIQVAGRIGWG